MREQDGPVPAPRRGRPLRRRSRIGGLSFEPASPAPSPASGPDVPRVAEISALLAEIDALRTTLSTDMSLAAAALEAGAEDIAGEIVAGDLSALHGFERSALGHLHSLDVPPVTTSPLDGPVLPRAARRRSRRMLPAAPVLAAAALIGFVTGVVPEQATRPSAPAMSSAAAASWELNRLADSGASADELREAAEQLNEELAALVAVAGSDPAAAQQALLLLRDTTEVLQTADRPAELGDVLREARALVARLTAVLPRVPRTLRPAARVLVLPIEAPRPRRTTSERSSSSGGSTSSSTSTSASSSSSTSTSAPRPASTPEPSSTPAPAPQPAATPEPAATPTSSGGPLLPQSGDLPAV